MTQAGKLPEGSGQYILLVVFEGLLQCADEDTFQQQFLGASRLPKGQRDIWTENPDYCTRFSGLAEEAMDIQRENERR